MDFTQALVRAILEGGKPAYREFLARGVPADIIQGVAAPALEYIVEHYTQYGVLPGIPIIENKLGIPLPPLLEGGTAGFWADEIVKNAIGNEVKKSIDASLDLLQNQKNIESFEELQQAVFRIQRLRVGNEDSRVTSMLDEGPRVWEYYQRMKAGERGILTPWPTMNDTTLGFNQEELILFVSRSGTGKTFLSLMLAEHAWSGYDVPTKPRLPDGSFGEAVTVNRKHKVLYVTTEMSKLRIALRFYALQQKVSFGRLRSGGLTVFEEEKLKKAALSGLNDTGLSIVGGNFDFRIETLAAAIDDAQPELVIIDGIYLIKVPGKDRVEQAANAFGEVKRLTVSKKLPIVVTSQFNREVKKNQAATAAAESIALTDAAVWHSTLIFGMVQTDDNKKEKRMQVKQLKVRDGAGEDFELNWDFEASNFSEVSKGPGGGVTDASNVGGGGSFGGEVGGDNVPF